jgi:hypothetical protein
MSSRCLLLIFVCGYNSLSLSLSSNKKRQKYHTMHVSSLVSSRDERYDSPIDGCCIVSGFYKHLQFETFGKRYFQKPFQKWRVKPLRKTGKTANVKIAFSTRQRGGEASRRERAQPRVSQKPSSIIKHHHDEHYYYYYYHYYFLLQG